ncbi:MAG: hypothetical protein IJV83_03480 [Clostridia bacterium]|nr:hypothetical protein [Clostridia bacterium]
MQKAIAKMKTFTKGDWIKAVTTALGLLFALFSIIFFATQTEWDDMALSFATIAYVLIPIAVERLFKFRIQPVLYIFILIYTVCPLIGSSYNFYLIFSWWDDMLHGFAGVIFAMFGAYLPRVFHKNAKPSVALGALMGFVFSLAVAGVWEFIEFGMDSIFDTDMQKDTWLTSTRPSYFLGKIIGLPDGALASAGNTTITTIVTDANGITIYEKMGYLDIGLIDSMHDMLIETLGALIYTVIYIVGKGKKFVFVPVEKPVAIDAPAKPEAVLEEVAPAADPSNET